MSEDVKAAIKDVAQAFEAFKAENDVRLTEIAEKGAVDPLITDKLAKIEADMDAAKARADQMERDRQYDALHGRLEDGMTPQQRDYRDAFIGWVRQPKSQRAVASLQEANLQLKDIQTTVPSDGGYAVPEVIAAQIEAKLKDISPMRQRATVRSISTSDYKELVDVKGATGGWVGETGTRNPTETPSLAQVTPTLGTVYAYPSATEESLQDMFFDVQSWLVSSVVETFAELEGNAFISGDGTNKPTGVLTGTPVAIGDDDSPARAFGTLEYVPTGAAGAFANGPGDSPAGTGQDVFLSTVYKLKAGYRSAARWAMNKSVLEEVRKMKDVDGNYLWAPGLQAGEPSSLVGYPVTEDEGMPAIAANSFSIGFGDWSGYLVVDRVGVSMTVDEITTPGYVKYYTRKRVGGILKNDDKIKVIKFAAS